MKRIALFAALLASVLVAVPIGEAWAKSNRSSSGSTSVKGYTKKDGTYVAPHQRTNPNSGKSDNWSTKGNVNPNTGKPGTKNPY